MNFSRGNISNTKKALTEQKWNLKRIMALCLISDWCLSNLSHFNACEACDKYHGFVLGASDSTTHFFKYKLRFSGIKVKSDSFCPRFNFVLSPKSDLLWLYSIFNGTFYCKWTFWIRHHKDTLIALIEHYETKLSFKGTHLDSIRI